MTQGIYWNIDSWQSGHNCRLAERKEEWDCVRHNLKAFSSTEFSGRYLTLHKKLFFEGIVEPDKFKEHGDREFQFLLPLFVIWYHPDLSEKVIEDVIDWGCSSWSRAGTMAKCREFIAKVAFNAPALHDDYGLFGGREATIVAALWGKPLVGTRFDQVKPEANEGGTLRQAALNSDRVSSLFWSAVMRRLTNGKKFEHVYGQYLYHHAAAVSHLVSSFSLGYVGTVASNVLYFDESPIADHASESSRAMRDIMIRRYEKGQFHEAIQNVWDKVSAGDKNFYE